MFDLTSVLPLGKLFITLYQTVSSLAMVIEISVAAVALLQHAAYLIGMKELKTMKCKNHILLAVVFCVVLLQLGCSETARTESAHRRFDRVMEQARIDVALESVEQGRLRYAIRILENLIESGSAFSDQAEATLKDLRFATQQMAIARDADTDLQVN